MSTAGSCCYRSRRLRPAIYRFNLFLHGDFTIDYLSYFAQDYQQARRKFLEAADVAGAELVEHRHPLPGPDGRPLYMDVALYGPASAGKVLLCTSGVHGVEGFCGSAALTGWFRSGEYRALADDCRAVLVHAVNPYGFAWLRRVNEDNIDLNRNFLDHDQPYPDNPGYRDIHDMLLPESWDDDSIAKVNAAMRDYAEARGDDALRDAVGRGQYSHPTGLFFGGNAPAWSNDTLRQILRDHVAGARAVASHDFHTGLGAYGAVDMISGWEPGTPAGDRMYEIYGEGLSNPMSGTSTSRPLSGFVNLAIEEEIAPAASTGMTMEFGTYPMPQVQEALIADNWLHAKGALDSDRGRAIKAAIRRAFYPDEDNWKELIAVRSRQIMRRAVTGLAQQPLG